MEMVPDPFPGRHRQENIDVRFPDLLSNGPVMGQQLRKRVKRKARERRIKRLKERARAAKAKA